MAELSAISPCEGLLPLRIGSQSLTEETSGAMTSLAPGKGGDKPLSQALKVAHGLAYPALNRTTGKPGARAIWFGRGQAMLLGPVPDPALGAHATLTDQSDAWAVVRLEGAAATDVLARLVPLDLRGKQFRRGHTARTELAHMMASVTRVGDKAFIIMVFRSMATTLVHDLKTAMEAVAARG